MGVSILIGPDKHKHYQCIKDIKSVKFGIKVNGNLQDFLGVNIDHNKDGSTNLTQPHMIHHIMKYSKTN